MVVALIGLIALVASAASWFAPGIALGAGLIALGVALELSDRGNGGADGRRERRPLQLS